MMQICCQCDWDLGVELPPHIHVTRQHVFTEDGRWAGWTSSLLPDSGFRIAQEIDEISFSVPWKELWRQEGLDVHV